MEWNPRENNQNQPVSPEGGVNQTPAPRQEQEKKVNWFFSDGTQAQPGVSSPQESARQTQEEQQPKLEQVPPQQAPQFAFSSSSAPAGKPPKKKKNKAVVAVACVLAGALLLGAGGLGGAFLMRQLDGEGGQLSSSSQSSTRLEISETPETVSSTTDGTLTGSEIYEKVSPSVVGVSVVTAEGQGTGTGIIMSADGYIITNNHVIEDATTIVVVTAEGQQYTAQLVGADEKTDLAVLKIEPEEELTPAEFGDSDQLQVGDIAYAIGNPSGLELQNSLSGGWISAINRNITIDDRVMTLIQTDVSINPGNSGGPLINEYGQVVGITTAKLGISYYEGLGFAIPMSSAQDIINELIANGRVIGRPAIGISGQDVSAQMAQYYNWPQGLYVQSVDSRSDAYGKLQQGDIIVSVNGETVTSMAEINAIKDTMEAGDQLTLGVYRSGQTLEVTITLMDEEVFAQEEQTTQDQQNNSSGSYYGFPFGNYSYGYGY